MFDVSLLQGLRGLSGGERSTIGVKTMGQVDEKPFLRVCEQRFSGQDVALQSARLCSEWQERVGDPRWQPFKIQTCGDKFEVLFYYVFSCSSFPVCFFFFFFCGYRDSVLLSCCCYCRRLWMRKMRNLRN